MKNLLVLTAIIITVLTATAASADFHEGGFDDSCLLCQVNHLPLADISTAPIIPESSHALWWVQVEHPCRYQHLSLNLGTGRSPPSIV